MVAGGFKNDLAALNDTTPHDERYDRLVEYTLIIKDLLRGEKPVSYAGRYYKVQNLKLSPPCPESLLPGIFTSGSSEAGLAAAKATGAVAIQYPKPVHDYKDAGTEGLNGAGIRIGIISREHADEAWAHAHERFPQDRKGQITRELAMKVSDSVWHKQLWDLRKTSEQSPYWLVPFENYKTMCPYLVGDYQEVAQELSGYIGLGYRTFITDIPCVAEELQHIGVAFDRALEAYRWQSSSRTG
jgi:alkanesulfonate monooxygenase